MEQWKRPGIQNQKKPNFHSRLTLVKVAPDKPGILSETLPFCKMRIMTSDLSTSQKRHKAQKRQSEICIYEGIQIPSEVSHFSSGTLTTFSLCSSTLGSLSPHNPWILINRQKEKKGCHINHFNSALTCLSYPFPRANGKRKRSKSVTYPLWLSASSSSLPSQFPIWGLLNKSKWHSEAIQRLTFERDYMHAVSHFAVKSKLFLTWVTKG